MIRPILKFGEPPLQARAADVGELTPDIQKLIDDMIETMYAAPGIGLAAPQIGVVTSHLRRRSVARTQAPTT